MKRLLTAGLFGMAMIPAAAAEPDAARFRLRQAEPTTGTNITAEIALSALPFDKRYSELSPDQQRRVKSLYAGLGADDEPPFPANGLGPIYKAIAAAQQKLLITGALSVAVEVNGSGEPVSVSVLQSSDPKMTQFVAAVLMREAYKPALCSGSPCSMQFPFRMQFQTRF